MNTPTQTPTIIPIVIPVDDLEILKKCLASNLSSATRDNLQPKTCGKCRVCGGIPDYVLSYDYDTIVMIKKFCTSCLRERENNLVKAKEIESQVTIVQSCSEYIESLELEQEQERNETK